MTAWFLVFRQPQSAPEQYWLGEAGFSTDTPVTVSMEQVRLVIEPVKG
ncbi:SymE family type I addiction module toxin [Leclercia sp.]